MEIRIFESYEALSKSAAEEIIKQVKQNPKSVIGFATGSSPVGLYRELIKDYNEGKTSYSGITSFNLDEYVGIDKNHSQSYYNFMQENLFKQINVKESNINIPSGVAKDILTECTEYNQKLSGSPIDIQILGIGRNGHIGFNEPGTSFDSVTHTVTLDEKTRKDNARFFNSLDEVPTEAVTMGIKNILDTKKILIIASGESKADAVFSMIKEAPHENCPASALQKHNNVIVFLDKQAASKIIL